MATRAKKTQEIPADCLPMCSTCNAYSPTKGHDDQGSCRAYPPQMTVVNDELGAEFPVVFHDEWCRFYERKTN